MQIIIIAAISSNNAIGKDNNLLWHLPADMNFFKEQTTGFPIITGRKNYESIPEKFRPLPNRTNIVVTRDVNYQSPGAIVVNSLEKALEEAQKEGKEKCFIIGGGQIYKEAMEKNLADELLITHVDAKFEADTFFPEIKADAWDKMELNRLEADEKNKFSMVFCKYTRKKS